MIRIAIIGFGYWGPNLVRNFVASQTFDVRLICDSSESKLERARQLYPRVAITDDPGEVMTAEVDAVVIATPAKTHFRLGKQALASGKHVLMEKPLALAIAEAAELVDISRQRDRILMVDHTYLYSPAVREIKRRIDRGELGELLYIDSVRVNLGVCHSDINVIWDLLTHDLSILDYWTDEKANWLSTDAAALSARQVHQAYVSVGYDGPLFGHVHVNWYSPVKIRRMLVGGSEGLIVYDDLSSHEKVRIYAPGVDLEREEALVDYRSSDVRIPRLPSTEPLQALCQAFATAIQTGEPPLSDGALGLAVVRQLAAAQASMDDNGRRHQVDWP